MVTFHNTGTQHKMNHFQVMSTHVTSNEEKCPSKGNFGMLVLLLITLTKIYITKGFVLYVSRAGTKLDPAELMRLFWVRCFSLVIYLREVLGWKHLPHVVFYEEYCKQFTYAIFINMLHCTYRLNQVIIRLSRKLRKDSLYGDGMNWFHVT